MTDHKTVRGIIAIETQQPAQHVLDKAQAAQLIGLVSQDLAAIIKDINQCSLTLAAAIYPVEQILRVGFPIHSRLQKYAEAALQGSEKQQQLLSIGGNKGQLPDGLQPKNSTQNFVLMPFIISGLNTESQDRFEQQLMHKGMISPPTYAFLCEAFDQQLTHVNYMTNLDLVAMMHNHYQQMHQSALWQLIEHALVGDQATQLHELPQGNYFYLLGDTVFTPFFTHKEFNKQQKNLPYALWLLQQRLSVSTLRSHGLKVQQFKPGTWKPDDIKTCLGQINQQTIQQSFVTEANGEIDASQTLEMTHYHAAEAGLVAIAIGRADEHSRIVYYPIEAHGIEDIQQHIAQHHPNISRRQDKNIDDI